MKKIMTALVATMIASTCIFFACSKENETEKDNNSAQTMANEVMGTVEDGFYYGQIHKMDKSITSVVNLFENNELVTTWINGEKVYPTNGMTTYRTIAGSRTTSIETDAYGIYEQLYEKYPCVEMVRTVEASFSGFGTRVVYTIYYGYYDENGNCFYE